MLKEVNKIIDLAIDFSRNNLEALMMGGICLIVLVIIISLVKSSKDGNEEDFDFDEAKYRRLKETRQEEQEEKPEEEPEESKPLAEQPEKEELETPIVAKNPSCIENLLGEIASFSSEGVKELKIKIQGAEVKITYLGQDNDDQDQECLGNVSEEPTQVELEEETAIEEQTVLEDSNESEDMKPGEDKGKTYKKFGTDNNNISKSGRIYTEEELEKQIRD